MSRPGGSSALAFLPDGRLVTAGRPGVTVWNVRTGDYRLLPLPGVWQRSLVVAPGGTVWTGDDRGVLREWDLEAGRVVRRLDGVVEGSLVGLVLTPDGARLRWISGQGYLGAVDLTTGSAQGEPRKPDRFGHRLVASSRGTYVAWCTDRAVELANGDTGEVLHRFEYTTGRGRPRSVTFAPDESSLLIGVQTPAQLEHFLLPDLAPGPLHEWEVGQSGAYELTFLPGGEAIAYGQIKDTTLRAYPGGEVLGTLSQEKSGYVAGLAASPDGETLAIYGAEGPLRFWDIRTQRPRLREDTESDDVLAVAVDDTYQLIATGDEAGRVRRWSLLDGEELLPVFRGSGRPFCRVAFDEDGVLEVTSVQRHGATRRWWLDPATGEQTGRGDLEGETRFFRDAYTPDGSLVVRSEKPRRPTIQIVETATDKVLAEKIPHPNEGRKQGTRMAAFHPSGRYLATAGTDRTVRLHRAQGFEEVLCLEEPLALRGFFPESPKWNSSSRLAFSPDGRLLALGGVEGSLMLYELELVDERRPGERLRLERRVHVVAHSGPIHAIAFGRSSSVLVTASSDGSALAWDLDQVLSMHHESLDLDPV